MCIKFLVYRRKSAHGHYRYHTDVYKTGQVLGARVCVNTWAASGEQSAGTSNVRVDEVNKAGCEHGWGKGESVSIQEK